MRHRGVHLGAEMHAGARELFEHHALVRKCAAAAVCLGHIGKQQPRARGLQPGVGVGAVLGAPARLLGHELLRDERAHVVAEHAHVVIDPG